MQLELGKIAVLCMMSTGISIGLGVICLTIGVIWRMFEPESRNPKAFVIITAGLAFLGTMPGMGGLVAIMIILVFKA